MLGMKFPCFKPHTMDNLRARFRPDLDIRVSVLASSFCFFSNSFSKDACKFFTDDVILASWSRGSQFTTKLYDRFQAFQNKIDY